MLWIYTQSLVSVCAQRLYFPPALEHVNVYMPLWCSLVCANRTVSPTVSLGWRALTMTLLLPEARLTGTVGRLGQACAASPPVLCSAPLWERWDVAIPLEWIDGAWGASLWFEMQPNMVPVKDFKQRYSSFFPGIYSSKHWLFLRADQSPNQAKIIANKIYVWMTPWTEQSREGALI